MLLQFVRDNQAVVVQTAPTPVQEVGDVDNENVRITLVGSTLNVYIKPLNSLIEAEWYSRNYMNYRMFVPSSVCRASYGHLANCDSNLSNDVSVFGVNDCKYIEQITLH